MRLKTKDERSETKDKKLNTIKIIIMKNLIAIALTILATFFASNLIAQDQSYNENQRIIVTMDNGAIYEGTVLRETETELILTTENANISLQKNQFKKVETVEYDGDFLFRNSHGTRYFYSPTAIPLKKGEGYYQNLMLVANSANVGITDNISIGGGFEFISAISGNPILFLTPKVGFQIADKLHVGAGVRAISFDGEFYSTPFGVITYGTTESNVSIATGANITLGNPENFGFGPTVISASHRLSNRVSIMTENYLWKLNNDFIGDVVEGNVVLFGVHGVRLHTRKSTFDFGVMTTNLLQDSDLPVDYLVPIPYIGYSYAFSLAKNKI